VKIPVLPCPGWIRSAWAAFVAEWNRPSKMDRAIEGLIEAGEAGRRADMARARVLRVCATCGRFAPYPANVLPGGLCRRFPPTLNAVGESVFPAVSEDTTCGEYLVSPAVLADEIAKAEAQHDQYKATCERARKMQEERMKGGG
jgi:hypothetical protein